MINFNIDNQIFMQNYLYKTPFLFKNALLNNIISWQNINDIYNRADCTKESFKLMNGYAVPKHEYIEAFNNVGITEYRMITSVLYEYLRNGATLVYNRITHEPLIDEISQQIANFANAQTITSGYLALTSSKSSYKAHWDTRDVFAVQLLGRKRWILKQPNFELPLYMQQTKDMNIDEPEDVYMDVILEAGDILYIPRGWWHNPLPIGEETFHLAVGTFAPTGFDYVQWLLNAVPNHLDCRRNLHDFKQDFSTLESIADYLATIVKDKSHFDDFLTYYFGEHRLPSMLSLDKLGNNQIEQLGLQQKVRLNANLLHIFDEGYVIINGSKINIDDMSLSIIQYLYEHPNIQVEQILKNFSNYDNDKLEKLLFRLALDDIIQLVY